MDWYIKVLKQYFDFSGRARRKEYWMFGLINLIFCIVLMLADQALGTVFIYSLYSIAVLIPGIAVSVRRLHDTDRTGWWLLIGLIPLVGIIALLVFFCLDSKEDNDYGANPKAVNTDV
ncbi:hypothetical protein BCU94_16120 [Shewanella sp. 10N.286.52.C2]|uniref:DUF805 domain-containing protein n=1 Tax=Shewanella sp. 10N.286.52.C2 TaxID=1880838 RepID=UPI000C818520|nr:DUF805 domain-containing protein [Shewanella sp. 10N.286.52.C2]PMG28724.1 hypothetical protein BCU94_16120 [Shewanella sp. 10N.286.52.C2]